MDVFQNRVAHYAESAAVLATVERGETQGLLPAHAVTTLYYLIRKYGSRPDAEQAMDRLLSHFEIGNLLAADWHTARTLPMNDFEDAVTAMTALSCSCCAIVTRNVRDFIHSPVPAMSPLDFLDSLPTPQPSH